MRSERERKASPNARRHLHMVRLYGDSLAFNWLSAYALRQLRRNGGKPPDLSGQGDAFTVSVNVCESANRAGTPAILCDITNILKIGDVVICENPDAPAIVECKASIRRNARFDRQGRRGRQLSRMKGVSEFLRTGEGRFFGDTRYRRTAQLANEPTYDFEPVDQVVNRALNGEPGVYMLNDFQLYLAARSGDDVAFDDLLGAWKVNAGEYVLIGDASEPLVGAWADVRPPVLWNLSAACRWALMEGDVSLLHVVRANALVGIERDHLRVIAAVERPADCEADTSWVYELSVSGEPMFMSPSLLYHMAYGHETLESCRRRLLDTAEAAIEFHASVPADTSSDA